MTIDQNLAHKAPGDPVRSADWNDLAAAVLQQQAGKLDLAGGTVTGPLTAQGGLTTPALHSSGLGVQMLKPAGGQWAFDVTGTSVPAITQQVTFETATTLLLVGHGHGTSSGAASPLVVHLLVDGVVVNKEGTAEWGVGYVAVQAGTWVPVTTLGTCEVAAGSHTFELLVTGGASQATASLHGPTLWVVRLGAA